LHADSHARLHALDSASDHSGTITDAQHGSRGSGLHADSHALDHRGRQLLQVGTDAGKPAAGTVGRIYYATDTKIFYYDNGTTWEEYLRAETVSRLASLAEKSHASLTDVTADQHHARSHDHSLAADGSPIAETGVPVLTDAKYPNAILRDGSRTLAGNLVPDGSFTRDLGSSTYNFRLGYFHELLSVGNTLDVVASSGYALVLGANGSWEWAIATDGHIYPRYNNTYAIGDASYKPSKIYAVSTNWGEVGFSDTICRKCAEPFKVGDEVVLKVFEIKAGYIETVPIHKDCVEKAFKPLAEDEYEVINEAVLDEEFMQLNVRFGDGLFAAIPVKIDGLEEEVEETIRKYHNDIKADREKKEKAVKKGESKKKVSWKGRKGKLNLIREEL
jgi:hypothetical protein